MCVGVRVDVGNPCVSLDGLQMRWYVVSAGSHGVPLLLFSPQ